MKPTQIQAVKQEPNQSTNHEIDLASKILFVIVLYKTCLNDSLSYNSLKEAVTSFLPDYKVDLLLCDNSPVSQVTSNEFENEGCFNVSYLYDSNNPGISLSYNRAAELASQKKKDWILVLDQDSILPVNALGKYISALQKWPDYPIYTPQVYSSNILLSPCRYFIHRGSPLPEIKPGVYNLEGKNVVNSGLLISLDAFREAGGYDEKVWLYFSDFVFFDRLKKYYKNFIVIDCCIEHELSSSDYSDFEFAYSRFTYYCQGAKEASRSSGSVNAYFGYGLTVGLRSILMCRRFRNFSFMKIFFNTFIIGK